jgi:nucleoporin p58/p45
MPKLCHVICKSGLGKVRAAGSQRAGLCHCVLIDKNSLRRCSKDVWKRVKAKLRLEYQHICGEVSSFLDLLMPHKSSYKIPRELQAEFPSKELANTFFYSAPSPFGASSNPPAGGSLFGGFGSSAASKPQQQGGLFGPTPTQPTQSGGLFGSASSQPTQGGGLFAPATSQTSSGGLFGATASQPSGGAPFGTTTSQTAGGGLFRSSSQPAQSGGLFGSATTQPSQSGGLFGSTTSQSTTGGGLFGTAMSQPAPIGGLFGSTSQPTQTGGLFGTGASSQPASSSFFGSAASQQPQGSRLFGAMQPSQPQGGLFTASHPPTGGSLFGGLNQTTSNRPAATLNLGQQSALGTSASTAKIDLEHLRPTTKWDQLTDELQREILNLDTAILNEINKCHEVSDLLPAIAGSGSNIPNDVAYVTQRLEEVETGLENDAEDIQALKEQTVKKDANEAKICFRAVDRLKMPAQYQASVAGPANSITAGVYGGHGLSGWWNHPQTLRRSIRGAGGAGGSRLLQLPGDDDDGILDGGPSSLLDLFERRTDEMKQSLAENKALLSEIEEFVGSVEGKIAAKQREVMGREGRLNGVQGEEDQVGLLRYVFGEFERSLYEVADKVGGTRDGVQELVIGDLGGRHRPDRLAW